MQLADRGFIISGGASGLGEATARHLHAQGASVLIADLNAEAGEALAGELGERASFAATDVTDAGACEAAVSAAAGQPGALAGAVNCAGIAIGEKLVGRDGPHALESFSRCLQINLVGSFNLMRLVAAALTTAEPGADGERGVIINTASIAAYDGQIGQCAYAASKGGIVAMTLPAARELARHGIRVNTVAPGIFRTPMMAGLPQEVQDSLGATVPFPARLGLPEEFAHLVASIITNPMLNGETIRLDGALRMAPR